MKITHLFHSGVLIELDSHILLFDYYQGNLELNINKPLYIFVSHRHYDHYNPEIFRLNHPSITYILSSDLRHKYDGHYVDVHQDYHFDDVFVKTLLSTDAGCAFIVEVENKTIYYSGDLNWWHWDEESHKDNDYQRMTYMQEINSINQSFDLSFVVVDKRQKGYYLQGLQYFLTHVRSRYIMPIHYFGDYSISKQLPKEKLNNKYQATFLLPHHTDETFEVFL